METLVVAMITMVAEVIAVDDEFGSFNVYPVAFSLWCR